MKNVRKNMLLSKNFPRCQTREKNKNFTSGIRKQLRSSNGAWSTISLNLDFMNRIQNTNVTEFETRVQIEIVGTFATLESRDLVSK